MTELGKSALLKGKETSGSNNKKKQIINMMIVTFIEQPTSISTYSIRPNPSVGSRN